MVYPVALLDADLGLKMKPLKYFRALVATIVLALVGSWLLFGVSPVFAAPNPPTVDQTFPDPWITASNQPSVQGSMDAGVTQINVEYSTDGVNYSPYCTVPTTPPTTIWFCNSPTGTLPLGLNYIRATATDSVPSTSAPGPAITITVVRQPTITSPSDGFWSKYNSPTFVGDSDGSYFDVYTSDFLTHMCGGTVVNQSWNCVSAPLPDGDYTYLVQSTFGATTIFSSYRTIHIDTVAPLPPTINPPTTPSNSSPSIILTGTGEPDAGVTIWADGNPIDCADGTVDYLGNWGCVLTTSIPAGVHALQASQTDLATNESALGNTVPLTIIDNTPPGIPTVTGPSGTMSGSTLFATVVGHHPTITGTGEPGANLQILESGNPRTCTQGATVSGSGTFTCTISQQLSYGAHDLYFSQSDSSGNWSAAASQPQIRITLTAPPPAAKKPTQPAPEPTPTPIPEWNFSLSSDNPFPLPGDTVTLTGTGLPTGTDVSLVLHSDPVPLGTVTVTANGLFKISAMIPSDLKPGAHTFVATATDPSGLVKTAQLPVSVQPLPSIEVSPNQTDATPTPADSSGEQPVDPRSERRALAKTVDRNEPAAPSAFTGSLPQFSEVFSSPLGIAAGVGSGVALLFFVAFPAELVNSSLDENYARIFGRFRLPKMAWWERIKRRAKKRPLVGGIILTVVASLILSFADPRFGFDLTSLRLFLSCTIATFVLGYIANVITSWILKRNFKITSAIQLQPFGLLIALLGVIASRFLDFAPGLLIGLILTLTLGARVSRKGEVKYVISWASVLFGLSIIGWAIYNLVSGAIAKESFLGALFDDTVSAIAAAGLSTLVIALLPITYFDGRTLYRASKLRWALVYLVTVITFFVIVVGNGGLWGDIRQPLWVWILVMAVFSAVCLGIYWWFRTHPEEEEVGKVAKAATANTAAVNTATAKPAAAKATAAKTQPASKASSAAKSVTGKRQTKSSQK
ncbi:MAG: hypothetical protein KF844_00705 [Cryobacterium sp.]|nr:hypothetical protein [Cryobacterium sp.]